MTTAFVLAVALAAASPAAAGTATPPEPAAPRTATGTAFGEPLSMEVHDLPAAAAEAALGAAAREIAEIERLTSTGPGGGLAALDAAAGSGPQPADPRLVELLGRAVKFCLWTQGAHGPLGGDLYRLWGLREAADGMPRGAPLTAAVAAAGCGRVAVAPAASTVATAAGSRLELWGFAAGFAVDRAVAVLEEAGAGDGRVAIGPVVRGFGAGPGGAGWPAELAAPEPLGRSLADLRLRGEAVAVARLDARPLTIGGDRYAPWIDQRTGRPATGVVAVAAVTELAVDAQALAAAMFVLGNREGSLRLGTLRPAPAVMWLLGSGTGRPLVAAYHWSGRGR
jgi:thiamine biosynthesis lipoprotein